MLKMGVRGGGSVLSGNVSSEGIQLDVMVWTASARYKRFLLFIIAIYKGDPPPPLFHELSIFTRPERGSGYA